MKTGIFGGTFDPIHRGHIEIAYAFTERFCLDKLLIIPNCKQPGKSFCISPPETRLEMVKIAFDDGKYTDKIQVCDIEIKRGGSSYTYDTLKYISDNGYGKLYLLLGEDKLEGLESWYRYEDILSMCTLVYAGRGVEKDSKTEKTVEKFKKINPDIYSLGAEYINISSGMVRKAIDTGEDIKKYVTEPVYAYIAEKGLYLGNNI